MPIPKSNALWTIFFFLLGFIIITVPMTNPPVLMAFDKGYPSVKIGKISDPGYGLEYFRSHEILGSQNESLALGNTFLNPEYLCNRLSCNPADTPGIIKLEPRNTADLKSYPWALDSDMIQPEQFRVIIKLTAIKKFLNCIFYRKFICNEPQIRRPDCPKYTPSRIFAIVYLINGTSTLANKIFKNALFPRFWKAGKNIKQSMLR